MRRMVEKHSKSEFLMKQHCTKLEASLKGTEMQLVTLSDQIAQRTILYEAQERRWKSSLSSQTTLSSAKNTELVEIKARFEQLQDQYNRVDSDRMEAVLENRELRNAMNIIESERIEERERVERAENELTEAVHFSHQLQEQLDRVKGADLAELEESMAAENENIRDQADDREKELMRQLELSRESFLEETKHREALVDEMQVLHQRNRNLTELLQQVRLKMADAEPSNSPVFSVSTFDNLSDIEDAAGDVDSFVSSNVFVRRTNTSSSRRLSNGNFQSPAAAPPRVSPERNDLTPRSTNEPKAAGVMSVGGEIIGLNESFLTGELLQIIVTSKCLFCFNGQVMTLS